MQLTSLFFVATLSIPLVYADFLVLTDPRLYAPTEIPQIDPDDSVKWVISVASNIDAAWSSYKTAEATRPVHTSAQSAVEEFVATATISGIPPEITDPTIIAKFLAVPDWYSELPKEVRDYKESEANMYVSVQASVYGSAVSSTNAAPTAVSPGFGIVAVAAAGAAMIL